MNSNFAVDKSVDSICHFIKVLRVELFKVLHQNLRCRRLPNELLLLVRLLLMLELLLSLSRHIPTHCSSHAPTHHMRRLLRLNLLLAPCGLSHRLLLDHLRIRSGGLHYKCSARVVERLDQGVVCPPLLDGCRLDLHSLLIDIR